MSTLWELSGAMTGKKKGRRNVFLFFNILFFALVGGLLWLIVNAFIKLDWTWGICLIGYPAFFGGYVGGLFYLMQNNL